MNTTAMIAIGWMALTAVFTALFKPQTPEQYAKLALRYPRIADAWRVVGALGIDPVKAVMIIRELVRPEPTILLVVTNPPPPKFDDDDTKDGEP